MLFLNYATREFAAAAVRRWEGDSATLEHISDSGNSVYRFRQSEKPLILRLTDPKYRSKAWNLAELEYLRYLDSQEVAVGVPVPSTSGAFIEDVTIGQEEWMASVFTVAPGAVLDASSPYWNEALFRAWGSALGRMHRASTIYAPESGFRRWHWYEEDLAANALRYLPPDDPVSLREYEFLMTTLHSLPVNAATYGMTHADLGAQNFHYDPQHGITMFDFGNCCYHWYVSDIAIAYSTLRNHSPDAREMYQGWIIGGYRDVFPVDPIMWEHLSVFLRWRTLYVYLDRLERFGPTPTPEHREILGRLCERVHHHAAQG